MKLKRELALPPFAWLTDDSLADRNILLHVRSATVLEFFEDDGHIRLNPETIARKFVYTNRYGVEEKMIVAVHHAPLIDEESELTDEVLPAAIEYYKADCDKLDMEDEEYLLN